MQDKAKGGLYEGKNRHNQVVSSKSGTTQLPEHFQYGMRLDLLARLTTIRSAQPMGVTSWRRYSIITMPCPVPCVCELK